MKLMEFQTMWSENLKVYCSYENFKEAQDKMIPGIYLKGLGNFHSLESINPIFTGKVYYSGPLEKQIRLFKAFLIKLKRKLKLTKLIYKCI